MAEEFAELLGAAGDGRRGWLDLSQGLVRAARRARGLQGQVWPRSCRAEDTRRTPRHRAVLPGPRDRWQEGLWRVDLYRARLGRHYHGRVELSLRLRLQVSGSQQAVCNGG